MNGISVKSASLRASLVRAFGLRRRLDTSRPESFVTPRMPTAVSDHDWEATLRDFVTASYIRACERAKRKHAIAEAGIASWASIIRRCFDSLVDEGYEPAGAIQKIRLVMADEGVVVA